MNPSKAARTGSELWQVTHYWLTNLNNKVSKQYCKQELTTHPDYPALTAVTDFLDNGKMEYNAVQAEICHIHQMKYPLLAHIQQPGNAYMYLIADASQWELDREVTQHWSGIAIFPGSKTKFSTASNTDYLKQEIKKNRLKWLLAAAAVLLVLISVVILPSFKVSALFALSLIGLGISVLALGTELGYQSQAVKQVCGSVNKGGCEQVLKSKYAKGFWGITPADAAVLYFGTQIASYIAGFIYLPLHYAVHITALSAIVIIPWSIYTQAVKLKQWCALCLGIVMVLLLQVIAVLNYLPATIPYTGLAFFAVLFFVFLASFVPVKKLIKTNSSNKIKLAELKKWKTDINIFNLFWQQEQQVKTDVWPQDLAIGNPAAPILITVACNPYCNPCAKAHEHLDELLHRFAGKLKVQVRLLCFPENETDKKTIAVKAILQQAAVLDDKKDLQQMLTDWFALMDHDKWEQKWKLTEMPDVTKQVQQHTEWMKESDIQFTPTFFINGRKLPGRYNLADLELLLPEIFNISTITNN